MAADASYKYADLALFPDDGLRREIIDGELIVSPSPVTRHQRIVGRLFLAIGNHVVEHGGGEVFVAPFDVVLSDRNVVEPDLLFIADGQAEIVTEANVQGVPALVIEVVSNPRMDLVRKRDLYERFGVAEYWAIDPGTDRVEIYRPNAGAYGAPTILLAGDRLETLTLPSLVIDVAALLAP